MFNLESKYSVNAGVSIAMFDYQRVYMNYFLGIYEIHQLDWWDVIV